MTIEKTEHRIEFCKLFKIKIPLYEHFDYYMDLLYRSGEMPVVYDLMEKFNVYITRHENPSKYKLDDALPLASEFIRGTRSYALLEAKASKIKSQDFRNKNLRDKFVDKPCISLDIQSANFSVLCLYDEHGDFPHVWSEFVEFIGIDSFLALSKSFRQYAFGNTNPKMFEKIQKELIWDLRMKLNIEEQRLVYVSHDELIIHVGDENNQFDKSLMERIEAELNGWMVNNGVPIRGSAFMDKKCGNIVVREYYDQMDEVYRKEVMGSEGSKFFINLKKHVLKEELDQRDLLFKQNDSIAQWLVNENDEIIRSVSVKKRGFLEELEEKFPEINQDVRKKILNLALNYFQK